LFELGFKKIEKKLSVCAQDRVLARLNKRGAGGRGARFDGAHAPLNKYGGDAGDPRGPLGELGTGFGGECELARRSSICTIACPFWIERVWSGLLLFNQD